MGKQAQQRTIIQYMHNHANLLAPWKHNICIMVRVCILLRCEVSYEGLVKLRICLRIGLRCVHLAKHAACPSRRRRGFGWLPGARKRVCNLDLSFTAFVICRKAVDARIREHFFCVSFDATRNTKTRANAFCRKRLEA